MIADVIETLRSGNGSSLVPGWDDGYRAVKTIQMLYRSQGNEGIAVTTKNYEPEERALSLAFDLR